MEDENTKLKKEVENTLISAKYEVQELRQINQRQSDRLSGFDDALRLLNAHQREQLCGKSEDIVWRIDKTLKQLAEVK